MTLIAWIALLCLLVLVVRSLFRDRHPDTRLWDRERRRLAAEGATDDEAIAGATDAVRSRAYTEHFQGKTVRSIGRDPESGRWIVVFEDETYLPILLPEESG